MSTEIEMTTIQITKGQRRDLEAMKIIPEEPIFKVMERLLKELARLVEAENECKVKVLKESEKQ